MRQQGGRNEVVAPTVWGTNWDYFGAADCRRHTLCPCPCCLQEAPIVTILRSLRITEKYILDRNRTTKPASSEEMLIASILIVYDETAQTFMLKSMVLDLR